MTDKNADIEKALAMAGGQDMKKFYTSQISAQDQRAIRDALENIFQGKTLIEWSKGVSLLSAWKSALDSIRDEFFATSRRDAFTINLQRLVFEHRNFWQIKFYESENTSSLMSNTIDSNTIPELLKHAEFQKQQGYETIKKIMDKYESGFKPVKQVPQGSKVLDIVRGRNLEREHEYVHERTK